jgi:hypothetical protein
MSKKSWRLTMRTIKIKRMTKFTAEHIADLLAAGIAVKVIVGEA